MGSYKGVFSLIITVILLVSLVCCTYAEEEVGMGYVTVMANVPADFTYSLLLQLKHRDSNEEYTIIVPAEEGHLAKAKVQSGVYYTLVDVVTGGDQVYCPTCEGLEPHRFEYAGFLVVERDYDNLFEIFVIDPEHEEATVEQGVEEKPKAVEKYWEPRDEEPKKTIIEKVADSIGGESEENIKPRENLGKKLIKKNFFTLIMLLALCAVSVYIELQRRV